MNLAELIAAIEARVPPELSLAGDTSGYLGPENALTQDIRRVILRMDYLPDQPVPGDDDLLVLHHPPVCPPPGPAYVLHSGWDIVPGGAADALADLFHLTGCEPLDRTAGIGRVGMREDGPVSLEEFVRETAEKLGIPYLRLVPGKNPMVERIAVVPGFGLNPELIRTAGRCNADVYLSGDLTHPGAILGRHLGISLLDATHYCTELPGLYRLGTLITSCGVPAEIQDTRIPWELRRLS